MQKVLVISVGGSIINSGTINISFLKSLKQFLARRKEKIILVCGGGSNARTYSAAASTFSVSQNQLDLIGIQATLLNAELVRHIFSAPPVEQKPRPIYSRKLLVAAGWKTGSSTDYDAVLWALSNSQTTVINLSNTNYIYDKDPKYVDALPLAKLSWKQYLCLISNSWTPGLKTPFDPIASRLAAKHHLQVVCINGNNLSQLKKYLQGKHFVGSVIS